MNTYKLDPHLGDPRPRDPLWYSVRMAKKRHRCTQCGRDDGEAGPISKRGLCSQCAMDNMVSNAEQLRNKQGPAYNLWLKRSAEAAERNAANMQKWLDQQQQT